tara:strand:+ start:135 stop:1058 length:924 start_codon:yes stop_codon:yes gene_type:complete
MNNSYWQKFGLIFNPKILENKKLSAALMPIVEILNEEKELIRIYYAPRDEESKSEIHCFEISLKKPKKILRTSDSALFKHGKIGAFDDSGITPGNIVEVNGIKRLYYTGWNLTVSVPMNNSIGVAEMDSNNKFKRYGDGPILTRNLNEPYSCASPFVLFDDNKFKMWYASMDKWINTNEGPKHYYNIKYAESNDGLNWKREGIVAIDYENKNEYAFGRPFILKEDGIFKMWYSYRGDFYKIGYAESKDGIFWTRKDFCVGIDISEKGWDSEMIEYPYIFDCNNKRYMLYNGNGYGKTGIGLAILKNK